jgi:hypothetical protein
MPLLATLLFLAASSPADVRNEIVAAYQRSLAALDRGDAGAALAMDTNDWVSIVVGQPPKTRRELEPLIRRDIATLKPGPGWVATWRPDYERNGTTTGIQVYDVKVDGDTAIVLCLVGSTRDQVWTGSHVRDTWIKTNQGWRRRRHEKLTVNERLVNGKRPTD